MAAAWNSTIEDVELEEGDPPAVPDTLVGELGVAVVDEDLAAAGQTARDLRGVLEGLL